MQIPIPGTDDVVRLSVGNGFRLLGVLLGGLLAVGLIAWLFRREARLVHPILALGLLALRSMTLAVLWGLLFLQPAIEQIRREPLPSRLVILVDRSASTAVKDPQRSITEQLQLDAALRISRDVSATTLRAWAAEMDKLGPTSWLNNQPVPTREIVQKSIAAVGGLSRQQIAQRILMDDGASLLAALNAKHRVELLAFARQVAPLENVANITRSFPGNDATDLRLPLERALAPSEGGTLVGVVLLSDGVHNVGGSPLGLAEDAGQRGIPIYPIPLAPRRGPPDVAVVSLQAPANSPPDAEVLVEARVRVRSIRATSVKVRLEIPGQTAEEETLEHTGRDSVYTVRFTPKMSRKGRQALTVSTEPLPDDINPANNRKTAFVQVTDDKPQILLVDAEPRWEYRYISTVLGRDPSVNLSAVLFEQPLLGLTDEATRQRLKFPATRLPGLSPQGDPLGDAMCVILGDVSLQQIKPDERVRLERAVADAGRSLVIVAGKSAMPLTIPPDDPLARLLPITRPSIVASEEGFPLTLTQDGRQASILQLGTGMAESAKLWAKLPVHYWAAVGSAKPNAVALAVLPGSTPERERVVIARHNYGFGRVLYLGIDSTWRWRYREGDTLHHRFWGQVIRWATAEQTLAAGNDFVRFGTREGTYAVGQAVEVVARLGEAARPLTAESLGGARVWRLGPDGRQLEAVRMVRLSRREGMTRELSAQVTDLPPGDYAIELVIPEMSEQLALPRGPDGRPAEHRARFQVGAGESPETDELSGNWPLLEDIARLSGGHVYPPEQASELLQMLSNKQTYRETRTELPASRSFWTLAIVVLLLSCEWIARKRLGLP